MSETYRRPSIAGWLVPSSIGPFAVAYGAAILTALLGVDGYLRWLVLAVGLAVATVWGIVYVVIASLIDVALLSVKLRTLPNGVNAWLQSVAPPAVSIASYALIKPHKWWAAGPWAVIIAVLAPPLIAIIASRIFLGRKPS
jgi:hypothetical protein